MNLRYTYIFLNYPFLQLSTYLLTYILIVS